MDKNLEADKEISYQEAQGILNKLEGWMRTTNETLKTLALWYANLKIDIANLEHRLKKLENNNGKIIIARR